MGMDVAMMVLVGVGMVVRHRKMLHYNITGVHVVARPQAGLLERAKDRHTPRRAGVCVAWLALLGIRILARMILVGWPAPNSPGRHRVHMKPLPKLGWP